MVTSNQGYESSLIGCQSESCKKAHQRNVSLILAVLLLGISLCFFKYGGKHPHCPHSSSAYVKRVMIRGYFDDDSYFLLLSFRLCGSDQGLSGLMK